MCTQSDPMCILTDNLRPVPFRQGGEEIPLHSVKQLMQALRKFTAQQPRVMILDKRSGPQMFIGLRNDLAAMNLYVRPGSHRPWFARPNKSYSSEDAWITSEGEPCWFPSWAMMPVDDVIQLAAYIVERNELPHTVQWVNLKGQQLFALQEDNPEVPFGPRLMPPLQ